MKDLGHKKRYGAPKLWAEFPFKQLLWLIASPNQQTNKTGVTA